MSPKPFFLFVLACLLTGCLSPTAQPPTPTSPPTPLPVSQPSATPSATPSPTPPPFGHFSVVDGAPQVWDGGQYLPLPQEANLEGLTLQEADGGLVLVDGDGQARLRRENGAWVEVEQGFFSPENVAKMGSRFEVEEDGLYFVEPFSKTNERTLVPMEISEDGKTMTVTVNGETKEFSPEQFSVFEPLNRGEDRMLVLVAEDGSRIVWNEYSGEWIEDGWEKTDKLTDQQMRNFDALVWARLNGAEFKGAKNTGKYGKVVVSMSDGSSYFYLKKADNSSEKFWRPVKQWEYDGGNGRVRTMSVLQILNVNGNYSYILELGGVHSYGVDSNYFRLELGYEKAVIKGMAKLFGENSLFAELRIANKIYENGQPTQWTLDCLNAWYKDITAFEKNYFQMRDPDQP